MRDNFISILFVLKKKRNKMNLNVFFVRNITMNHLQKDMIKRAEELASLTNEKCGYNCGSGCVITDAENHILAETREQVTELNDPTAHSAILAIRKACRIINHHELPICVLYMNGKPCSMCLFAIDYAKITNTFYKNISNNVAKKEECKTQSSREKEESHLWLNKKDKLLY
jgi:tRNA(Arg) A34 adenosine deaminase TadA